MFLQLVLRSKTQRNSTIYCHIELLYFHGFYKEHTYFNNHGIFMCFFARKRNGTLILCKQIIVQNVYYQVNQNTNDNVN